MRIIGTGLLVAFLAAFSLFPVSPLFAEEGSPTAFYNILDVHRLDPLVFYAEPEAAIPLGSGAELFGIGGGVKIGAEFLIPPFPYLGFGIRAGYAINPVADLDLTVSTISGAGVVTGNLNFSRWFELQLFGGGGYYLSLLNNPNDLWQTLSDRGAVSEQDNLQFNPYITAGVRARFRIMPELILGLGASYENYLSLYQGINASFSISFQPGQKRESPVGDALEGSHLQIQKLELDSLFPVFYKYYDDHPLGRFQAVNNSDSDIDQLKMTFFVPEYMNGPVPVSVPSALNRGESLNVEISALLNQNILNITEAAKTTAIIRLEYAADGQNYFIENRETLRLYDRNAIIWDDDRRAASFVTTHDLAVLGAAKPVASFVSGSSRNLLNTPFATAMALYHWLNLYGLNYVIDPKTPYAEFSAQQLELDYLQFPRYTLAHKAGDCDDLSILFSALLESVGISTAFITIPGHIYMAFDTGVSMDQAEEIFGSRENLIHYGESAWIPVEITLLGEDFLQAWFEGAKEWRQSFSQNSAEFYPLNEAWQIFEPVGLPSDPPELNPPDPSEVEQAFYTELNGFIAQMIGPQEQVLLARLTEGDDPRVRNRLAVLYARFGLLEQAEEQLLLALDQRDLLPALANLGNIYFMQGRFLEASDYYSRYYRARPDHVSAILNYARVNYELENFGTVKQLYARLEELDPAAAEQYSYLVLSSSEAARASDPRERLKTVNWEDEE